MKEIKLESFVIFEYYAKESIDCHAFIEIQPISIPKLILENYGCTNNNQIILLYEESVGIDKWLKYYGD